MKVSEYIEKVNNSNKSKINSENSFREDLQQLLKTLLPNLSITNKPMCIEYGIPNYIISEEGLPIAYIKTTDIGTDLNDLDATEEGRGKTSILNSNPTLEIHPPRSSGFLTVALMQSSWMCLGQLMMTSSQTLPRPGSPR